MKKKLYIQPRAVIIETDLSPYCDGVVQTSNLDDQGETDLEVREERFKLEQNVNTLSGTNVWNNEW